MTLSLILAATAKAGEAASKAYAHKGYGWEEKINIFIVGFFTIVLILFFILSFIFPEHYFGGRKRFL